MGDMSIIANDLLQALDIMRSDAGTIGRYIRYKGHDTRLIVVDPENSVFFEAWRDAMLASDPKAGELGGMFRAPTGRLVDQFRANPQFDAAKITVPTLVIRGALDTFATREDNQVLTEELGSTVKQYVEIPHASHMIPYEKANMQFYKAVTDFLDAKVEKKTP